MMVLNYLKFIVNKTNIGPIGFIKVNIGLVGICFGVEIDVRFLRKQTRKTQKTKKGSYDSYIVIFRFI